MKNVNEYNTQGDSLKFFSESHIEMLVLPEHVYLSLKKGLDVTVRLEEEMDHYGLRCSIEYKSPCG